MDTDRTPRRWGITPSMVRTHFALRAPPFGGVAPRISEIFRVPVGPGGGLPAHAEALRRHLERLVREEVAHQVSVRPPVGPVDVVIRLHWGMGVWVQVVDPGGTLRGAGNTVLRSHGFETDAPPEPWCSRSPRSQELNWYGEPDDPAAVSDAAARAIGVWHLLGIVDEDLLVYEVAPVSPAITLESWLDEPCEPDLVEEILMGLA